MSKSSSQKQQIQTWTLSINICFKRCMIHFHDRFPQLQFTGSYEACIWSHFSTTFAIHYFYNLAVIFLHSFLVQLFTGLPLDECVPIEVIEICARTTMYHVKTIVEMIHVFVSAGGRASDLPPFVRYCCFTTTTVYASFFDKDATISAELRRKVVSCLVVLDDLQRCWTPLKRLVRRSGKWGFQRCDLFHS